MNTLNTGVSESVWETPGAVLVSRGSPSGGARNDQYFAWEDYAAWDSPWWGYYGHQFNVSARDPMTSGVLYPLTLNVHAARGAGYFAPPAPLDTTGVRLSPSDLKFDDGPDPYTGKKRFYTGWFGSVRRSIAPMLAINNTEQRLLRYVKLISTDSAYQVDSNRIYAYGSSMGGGGALHMALHHPTVFAAAASVPWIDAEAWSGQDGWSDFAANPPVNSSNGPLWRNWQNMNWVVNHYAESFPVPPPPTIQTFRKDDPVIDESRYPAFLTSLEQKQFSYLAKWQDGGHAALWLTEPSASYLRFKKNEAYPVFTNSSTSNSTTAQEGQRNLFLDWGSSLHSLGSGTAIADTGTNFSMSFKSLQGNAIADVTIRQAQQFRPVPGQSIIWSNVPQGGGAALESGTVVADYPGTGHSAPPYSGFRQPS